MNNDKNKKIILVLIILTVIFTIIGGSLAYFSWISSESQKTNIVFTVERTFSCAADGGGSITNNSAIIVPTLVNSNTTGNYIKREVKVTPTINESGKTIYMDLWLDINKLDSGLSNSTHFNYAFTATDSYPTEATRSGNFNGLKVGDKIKLLESKEYNASTTDTYYLWIWLDANETSSDTMNQSFSLSLNGACVNHIESGAEMLISKANPTTLLYANATTEQKKEMWTFSEPQTEQLSETTDYRYIGASVNNFIKFNNNTCEIIGVFDKKIKIVCTTRVSDFDGKQGRVGSSTSNDGSNDWTDSQLMYLLNYSTYSLKEGYRKDGDNIKDANGNIIYQLGCVPKSIAVGATSYTCTKSSYTLTDTALSQITPADYYLGGVSDTNLSTTSLGTVDYYKAERSTKKYDDSRSVIWNGYVGLLYPSDYGYTFAYGVDNVCYDTLSSCNKYNSQSNPSASWLYLRYTYSILLTITPDIEYSNKIINIFNGGASSAIANRSLSNIMALYTVYLKEDLRLDGSGSDDDPYIIVG